MPPIDATDFGDVSILRDEPNVRDRTFEKVGGYCVHGIAGNAMNPGDVVVVSTAADDTYLTSTSANASGVAGVVVAALHETMQWDYRPTSAIAIGERVLVRITGVALVTASAAITRGDLVGTSTTAGRVATTTTQDASIGRALQTAAAAGVKIRVLLN